MAVGKKKKQSHQQTHVQTIKDNVTLCNEIKVSQELASRYVTFNTLCRYAKYSVKQEIQSVVILQQVGERTSIFPTLATTSSSVPGITKPGL
jgi:hypothetical protein